jgi:beta-1,4-mannosyl-glycoprotein beta-1,4-N-acetylglucosaminyltransferase
MKIIDCFIFYNEIDLLNYRLNILNEYVDYFIIVEGMYTFNGMSKNLIFKDNILLFEKFKDKIIHIIANDFPYIYPNINFKNNEQWKNEYYQRNCIDLGIKKINLVDEDLIIISDLDEIPDPNLLVQIKNNIIKIDINSLEMDLYYYNLNSKFNDKWYHAKIVSYKKYINLSLTCEQIRNFNCNSIQKGGWHLSYFGDANFIKNKIQHFSHQELNKEEFINTENIYKKIMNSKDLFDRYNINLNKILIINNNYLPPLYDIYLKNFILN